MSILLAGIAPIGVAAQTIVLADANIIDGTGGPVQEGMTIVISGDTIASITSGPYEAPDADADAQVRDLDGAWVLPGFWNMHTHLSIVFPDNHALDDETLPSKVIRAGLNAIDGLRHGFTSVRSVGEEDYIDVAWQRAFDQGFFVGPRVFASGEPVSPTAGHRGLVADGADGVAAIRKAVRSRVQQGARAIKLFSVEMLPDELAAAVETAHSLGVHVTSHVREPAARAAVEAGVDCLEHGYGLTDETNIRKTVMVFKGGVIVDLDAQLGTASYWDYFGPMELPEGFLAEVEEAAGFQRGATDSDQ